MKATVIQKWAWFFAANFIFIVVISHWPGFTDANGRLFGLFAIDPIDDIFHFLSGLVAAIVALHSHKWSTWYFKIAGIPYGIDAITGLFFNREFLNGDVFTQGLGSPNFALTNIAVNFPHILILASMLWLGYFFAPRVKPVAN